MGFSFPEYPEPTPMGARTWTAAVESFNQRTDDLYYVVTVREAGSPDRTFIVAVWPPWEWEDEEDAKAIAQHLHEQIHQIALTGATNTTYTGAMSRPSDPW